MAIDWDKPLRDARTKEQNIQLLVKDTTTDLYWVRLDHDGCVAAYAYNEDGTPLVPGHCVVENAPEEPEREEGLYFVDGGVVFWDGELWIDSPDPGPGEVGSRIYRDDEFRPANSPTGGPPMDGTPFEVIGVDGELVYKDQNGLSPVFVAAPGSPPLKLYPAIGIPEMLTKFWRPARGK